MNSTFKVVFNKARGALMVVNEVTSSVQAKGTKTVVATAVAAMIAGVAGVAQAETAADITVTAGKAVVEVTKAGDKNNFADGTNAVTATKFNVAKDQTLTVTTTDEVDLTIGVNGASNAGTLGAADKRFESITVGKTYSFTNAATGKIYATTVEAAEKSTLTNQGWIYTGDLNVDGTIKTGILSKDDGHIKFDKAVFNKGGTLVITDYLTGTYKDNQNKDVKYLDDVTVAYNAAAGNTTEATKVALGDRFVFADGELEFNGGQIVVEGKTTPLNIAALGTGEGANAITFTAGDYEFGNVEVYGTNTVTIGEAEKELSLKDVLIKPQFSSQG